MKRKIYTVDRERMSELKKHGYRQLTKCYFKELGEYWVIRIDKQTGELICRNLMHGKRKRFYIHRLVAELYISNPDNKPYVNHIDGNPKNNRCENLEWCTPLENVEHASKILGVMQQYKKSNLKKQRAVKQIDVVTQKVVGVYESIREAERQTGIKSSYISQICRGKFKQCFGYSWCYVEELKGE